MKTLLILLFPLVGFGQQSNAPEIVFPMVEQFVSEAYERKIPVYHKIREIDSINIEKLPYPLSGLYLRGNTYHSITVHKDDVRTQRSIEKSFYHEIGEVFDLPHSMKPRTIMNSDSYDLWFENETNWQKAKNEFFEQLKNKL